MSRILIADGAPIAWQARVGAFGLQSNKAMFETALALHEPEVVCVTVNIADGEALPTGVSLDAFDAVVLPGSPLHINDPDPEVTRQIDFVRAVITTRLPVWGSCWGLQLATVALGGTVRRNPNGRELGIARHIILTDAGRVDPVLGQRPASYDALCSHLDEVALLPPGGRVLAGNAHSAIQAIRAPTPGGGGFLGVQYHPEHDLTFSAALIRARADLLVTEGLARDKPAALSLAEDFYALHAEAAERRDLAWRYGLDPQVLDPLRRTADLGAWLGEVVRGRRA